MASFINPTNIDGTFPIAGQDNTSQGFRNNFTNIQNNFSVAAGEITDIQNKGVFTSALTGSTLNNNFNGSSISAVNIAGAGYILNNINGGGGVIGSVVLDFSLGNIQTITTAGSILLSFVNPSTWPTNGVYGKMSVVITVTSNLHTVTVPLGANGVTTGLNNIAGAVSATGAITFASAGLYILSFTTVNNGTDLLITDETRNYNSVQGNLTVTGGYINPNYIHAVQTSGATVTANVQYTNFYIDSASSSTLSAQTINLPSGVEDGRIIYITALCPITTTTWTGATVKYAASNVYSSGNVTVKLQYSTLANVWYRS